MLSSKTPSGMTAQRLRIILGVGLGLWVIVGGIIFWFFHGQLNSYAADVHKITAEASLSNDNIATLQRLQEELKDNRTSVDRTKNIVAESKQYMYQDQIIDDLNRYARASGVAIGSYTFTGAAGAGDAAGAPAAAAPAPEATPATETGAAEPGTEGAPAPTSSLKTTSVAITLKNDASYQSIIKFIRSIEQNLTKMQLAGVSLAKSSESNNISANGLTIEVYIK